MYVQKRKDLVYTRGMTSFSFWEPTIFLPTCLRTRVHSPPMDLYFLDKSCTRTETSHNLLWRV